MTTLEQKLDPGRKALWLEALRCGRYTQGQGMLADETPGGDRVHCCLGVYVAVCRPFHADDVVGVETSDMYHYAVGNDIDAFNQTSPAAWPGVYTVADYLAAMNDDGMHGPSKSFAEIADWIEASL